MTPRPRRRLSSRWTFVHKFVFPVCWVAVFATATVAMFLAPADAANDIHRVRWFLLAVTVSGTWLILNMTIPLKQVEIGERSFFVSNFRREIEVPFTDVVGVSRSRWVNPPRATLHLQPPGDFGDQIVFVLPPRLRFGGSVHPVVKELEELLARRPAT